MIANVSVIVPCFNVEAYVEECLDSVYAQTVEGLEVIVVDNNSTDNTLSILKRYKADKSNDLVILDQKKRGGSATRNRGLSFAKGEWIQFLDADDLLLPKKIEHQLNLIRKAKKQPSFVAGACIKRPIQYEDKKVRVSLNSAFIACFMKELGNTCSNLWNKYQIDLIEGWNEDLKSSQETDLMFRMLKKNEFVLVDNEPLTIIRERVSGQISDDSIENRIRYLELRLEMLDFFKKNKPEIYKKEWYHLYRVLYNWIRVISRTDSEKAAFYYQYIPKSFLPNESIRETFYKKMLDIVGFQRMERLRHHLTFSKY